MRKHNHSYVSSRILLARILQIIWTLIALSKFLVLAAELVHCWKR